MRIVIDMQGAQSASRFRGIGRYSLALALGVARNAGEHEVWLLMNGALPDAIAPLRESFAGLVPPERMRVFDVASPCAEHDPGSQWRTRANEKIREFALAELRPDAVLVTSLFEGYVDDAVCSVDQLGERTAVVLYDLIPFLKPDAYLGTATQRDYYDRKIASLRRAGLLLSISDYSRTEALDALGLDQDHVVSISTAIDERFTPASLAPGELAALNARFGITRKTVMYAPGGFDARKNIDGLVSAYASLPAALRAQHQLLIASKLDAGARDGLQRHARRAGMAADELLFTDYVDDDTLIALYRSAHLFVFPSRHEGFGLPALEAMACGAPVIGGDNTSLPEVIGLPEAMFDAENTGAIAARIAAVLQDPALRERLLTHGAVQSKRFSWDVTAQRALRAIEARWPAAVPGPAATPTPHESIEEPWPATAPDAAAAPSPQRPDNQSSAAPAAPVQGDLLDLVTDEVPAARPSAAPAAPVQGDLLDAVAAEPLTARTSAAPVAASAAPASPMSAARAAHMQSALPAPMTLEAPVTRTRRKLAFVSPFPPERTGIADYAAQCLPALLPWFDLTLILHQDRVDLPPDCTHLPQRDVAWFEAHGHKFDQVIYQFGNSPFHSHMFALLQRFPGVVVLHDFYLSSVLSYEQMTGAMPGIWTEALFHSHGYAAVQAALEPGAIEAARAAWPCNLEVLQGASDIIVHSGHARQLAREWYGPDADRDWHIVPLPRTAPPQQDRAAARRALGIGDDAFLVCSFGFVDGSKLSHRLLAAFAASPLAQEARCELVFVGANHGGDYGKQMLDAIAAAGLGTRVRINGWTDEAAYRQYLQAADVGVQLRSISRGETSAAVLDCMNYGLATIVNANGSMAALPEDAVWKLADDFETDALAAALTTLYTGAALRQQLGRAAAATIETAHRPTHAAALYAAVLDGAWERRGLSLPALVSAVARHAPADDSARRQLAHALGRLAAPSPQPRQLLVDVTNIVRNDLGTGIERVVRMQLLELLRHPASGFRIEPVYLSADGGWHYRYAPQYACRILGMDHVAGRDAPIDITAGDVLYAPDYAPAATLAAAQAGVYTAMRARGVRVNFLIHDLLPVLNPDFFPPGADQGHAAWLDCIASQGDRLVCISQAVADEMRAWLAQRQPGGARMPQFAVVHHGADIGHAGAAPGAPASPDPVLAQIAGRPSFLMVGTIEPRKGHLQALAAFEALWKEGVEANLVIVGHEGWKPLPPSERRTIPQVVERLNGHAELGHRLFWLKGIDDVLLQQVYRSSACLLAASEGEGFGLPLIEAARYELPLLARDIPVFREVAGDGALYFAGAEPEALARMVRAWLDLQATNEHPSPSAMKWQTWRQNADQLLAVLAS